MSDTPSKGFRGLKAWQKAMNLAEEIYKLTPKLPDSERFGLISQMQRAVVSIPCNISEGHGRSDKDFIRYLYISCGSSLELATQVELCVRLGFLKREMAIQVWQECQAVSRMLMRLIQVIKKRDK